MNYARRVRPFSTMVRPLGFRRDRALRLMAPDRCKPRFSGSRRTSSAPDDVGNKLATGVDIARSFEGLRSDRTASLAFEPAFLKPAALPTSNLSRTIRLIRRENPSTLGSFSPAERKNRV